MCADLIAPGRNLDPWRPDDSRLVLRRPQRDVAGPFVAVLGGSGTFGKFVPQPYPSLLADRIGLPVVNLGVMHAGVSLFSKERWLLDIASDARLTVLQVMGAQNMSNRLYCVHPRRNDRFLTSSQPLRDLYPEIDFTEFSFMGHMMASLRQCCEVRFGQVLEELQWAWMQRMRRVVTSIRGDVLLLWMSERSPDDPRGSAAGDDPLFVNRAMLDELAPDIVGVAEVVQRRTGPAGPDAPFGCARSDAPLHADVAEILAERIDALIGLANESPRLSAGASETAVPSGGIRAFRSVPARR